MKINYDKLILLFHKPHKLVVSLSDVRALSESLTVTKESGLGIQDAAQAFNYVLITQSITQI